MLKSPWLNHLQLAKSIPALVLVTCLLHAPLSAIAQSADESDTREQTATAPVESNNNKDNNASGDTSKSTAKTNKQPKANTEVFVPSESISEDFAVSFPVDI